MYEVTLDGQTFELSYDYRIANRMIRALAPNGRDRRLIEIIASNELEDWVVVLTAGLPGVHKETKRLSLADMRQSVEQVIRWIDQARVDGVDIDRDIVLPMRRAIGASRIVEFRGFEVKDDGEIIFEDRVLGKGGGPSTPPGAVSAQQ